jgi:hypothetical protein
MVNESNHDFLAEALSRLARELSEIAESAGNGCEVRRQLRGFNEALEALRRQLLELGEVDPDDLS